MITPRIAVKTITDDSVKAMRNIKGTEDLAVYVGIPQVENQRQLRGEQFTGKNRKRSIAGEAITNAELMFIHTHGVRHIDARRRVGAMMVNRGINYQAATELYLRSAGSMAYQIPPRPVIEPAIEAPDNKAAITEELKDALAAQLDGKRALAVTHMKRAGFEGQNRVKGWWDDPRNRWKPNAPSTIKRKGSSKPLLDSGQLRNSIVWVLGPKTK